MLSIDDPNWLTLGWLTADCIWSLLLDTKMAPAKLTPTKSGRRRLVSARERLGHQARPSEDNWINLSSTGLTSALGRRLGKNLSSFSYLMGECLSIAMFLIAMELKTQKGI